MSRLPAFAQGARFFVDTTPDQPRQQQSYVGTNSSCSTQSFSPRNPATAPANFQAPPRNFSPRGYRNFYPRQGYTPSARIRQWVPRRPNFSNPYEKQLTPRDYRPRQPRWQRTSRGGRAPLSSEFGPCASGASAETLAIIDPFVKPSMLEDPWESFQGSDELHSRAKKGKLDSVGSSSLSSKILPDNEGNPDNDEYDDDDDDDDNHHDDDDNDNHHDDDANDGNDDDEAEFNIRDFIPKM